LEGRVAQAVPASEGAQARRWAKTLSGVAVRSAVVTYERLADGDAPVGDRAAWSVFFARERRFSCVVGAGELVECVGDELVAVEVGAMRHPCGAGRMLVEFGDGELASFDE
jgi:hypothetical protein